MDSRIIIVAIIVVLVIVLFAYKSYASRRQVSAPYVPAPSVILISDVTLGITNSMPLTARHIRIYKRADDHTYRAIGSPIVKDMSGATLDSSQMKLIAPSALAPTRQDQLVLIMDVDLMQDRALSFIDLSKNAAADGLYVVITNNAGVQVDAQILQASKPIYQLTVKA